MLSALLITFSTIIAHLCSVRCQLLIQLLLNYCLIPYYLYNNYIAIFAQCLAYYLYNYYSSFLFSALLITYTIIIIHFYFLRFLIFMLLL